MKHPTSSSTDPPPPPSSRKTPSFNAPLKSSYGPAFLQKQSILVLSLSTYIQQLQKWRPRPSYIKHAVLAVETATSRRLLATPRFSPNQPTWTNKDSEGGEPWPSIDTNQQGWRYTFNLHGKRHDQTMIFLDWTSWCLVTTETNVIDLFWSKEMCVWSIWV